MSYKKGGTHCSEMVSASGLDSSICELLNFRSVGRRTCISPLKMSGLVKRRCKILKLLQISFDDWLRERALAMSQGRPSTLQPQDLLVQVWPAT